MDVFVCGVAGTLGKQPVGRALGSPSRQTRQLGFCATLDEWQRESGRLAVCWRTAVAQLESAFLEETPAPFAPYLWSQKCPGAFCYGERETEMAVNHRLTDKLECPSVGRSSLQTMPGELLPKQCNLTRKAFWDTHESSPLAPVPL